MVSINNIKCSECGGITHNGACIYCGNKIDKKIYEAFKGIDNLDEYYSIIRKKIANSEKLTEKEDKIFFNLLNYKLIPDGELDDLRVVYQILIRNKIVTYETFEELMLRASEKNMRAIAAGKIKNYNPKAFITMDDEVNGKAYRHYYIMLKKDVIKALYEGYYDALITYYHEINHVRQSVSLELGNFSPILMLILKDRIVRDFELRFNKTNNYYKDNYLYLPEEVHAEQTAINDTGRLLSSLYLTDESKILDKRRKQWPSNMTNRERKIRVNGKIEKVDIDEIFLEMINKDPNYIIRYQILNLEFINDNGAIRRKTKEELETLINYFNSDQMIVEYLTNVINNLDNSSFTN